MCVCLLSENGVLSLRPALFDVKQNSYAHLWPIVQVEVWNQAASLQLC